MINNEKNILVRKSNFYISALIFSCVLIGISVGFFLFGKNANAEKEPNLALAPEIISASFYAVASNVEPAVVNIDTVGKVPEIGFKGQGSESPIENELRNTPHRSTASVGSGFIVEKSGYILTNQHVIAESSKIKIRLKTEEEFVAEVVGEDEETDIAILKINAGKDLPTIKFGNSEEIKIGDWVLAIGSPFGLDQTVTAGIISQIGRETPNANGFQKFIQTDVAINRGNSGGPLVNMKNEVIGVVSQIASTTGDYNGISFALPINEAANVYRQILETGRVRRGYLGITPDTVKPEFAKIYEMPEAKGAIIAEIKDKESPAGKAGLQVHDVIIEIDGKSVKDAKDLIGKIAGFAPEKSISITYLREIGNKLEQRTTTAKLVERPNPNGKSELPSKTLTPKNTPKTDKPLGLSLVESGASYGELKGLLVKEIDITSPLIDVKNSAGFEALRTNDLILRINRRKVTDVKTFKEIATGLKTGDAVVLHVAGYSRQTRTLQERIIQFTIQ